jgi:hypothetical protein
MRIARAIVIAACMMIGPLAAGQHGSMSMSLLHETNSFRPDITQRDLKVIIRVLGLQGESLRALQDLYDGYAGTLASEGAEVREFVAGEIERAETLQNLGLIDQAQARIAQWNKRSEQIKKTFLDDLKSLLTRDEEARWPIVERELRRVRLASTGILSGENVDLVRLTEDVLGDSGQTTQVQELLNRYSEELDRVIVARKAALDTHKGEYSKAIKADPDKARSCWTTVTDARLAVQGVNDRYARLLAGEAGDKKLAYERAYFEKCYPALCRPSRVDEYLKDAQELKSLTAEQLGRLRTIKSTYEQRVWAQRLAAAPGWRDFETQHRAKVLADALNGEGRNPGEMSSRHEHYNGAWLPETHPINASRRDRLELDRDFRKQIDAVLTPEQRADIPSRLTPFARFENWEPYGI